MQRCPANPSLVTMLSPHSQDGTYSGSMSQNMVVAQPRPYTMTTTTTTSNEWSSGICDCVQDLPDCCLGFWCLPCFACKVSHDAGECICLPLLDCCGLIPPMTIALRVSVRERYGIQGTVCNDCVIAWCCGPCNWCQLSREIKTRKSPITFINMSSS